MGQDQGTHTAVAGGRSAGSSSSSHSVGPPLLRLVAAAVAGLLILIGCEETPANPCTSDSHCQDEQICDEQGLCVAGCRPESLECGLGRECVASFVPYLGREQGVCQAIPCTDDPLVCPPGSFCWPPPEMKDLMGSQCMPPPPCQGGSIGDAPACSEGACFHDFSGLTCDLIDVTNEQGVSEQACACVPL